MVVSLNLYFVYTRFYTNHIIQFDKINNFLSWHSQLSVPLLLKKCCIDQSWKKLLPYKISKLTKIYQRPVISICIEWSFLIIPVKFNFLINFRYLIFMFYELIMYLLIRLNSLFYLQIFQICQQWIFFIVRYPALVNIRSSLI